MSLRTLSYGAEIARSAIWRRVHTKPVSESALCFRAGESRHATVGAMDDHELGLEWRSLAHSGLRAGLLVDGEGFEIAIVAEAASVVYRMPQAVDVTFTTSDEALMAVGDATRLDEFLNLLGCAFGSGKRHNP